jgi:DNA-binding protein
MANIMEGTVGVVIIKAGGVSLGKTTAATELVKDKDWLDIVYQQTGTKPDDKVETGTAYQINATFGEITPTLITYLMNGVTKTAGGTLKFGKNVYTSLKGTFATRLEMIKVNSEGVESTDPYDKIVMYIAIPETTAGIPFDAGAQKTLAVTFHCMSKQYTNSKSGDIESAFGFMGIASSAGMPNS